MKSPFTCRQIKKAALPIPFSVLQSTSSNYYVKIKQTNIATFKKKIGLFRAHRQISVYSCGYFPLN